MLDMTIPEITNVVIAIGTFSAAVAALFAARMSAKQVRFQFEPRLRISDKQFQFRVHKDILEEIWWSPTTEDGRIVNGGSTDYCFRLENIGAGAATDILVALKYDYSKIFGTAQEKLTKNAPELEMSMDNWGINIKKEGRILGGFRVPDECRTHIDYLPPAGREAPFEGYAEKYAEVVNHLSCFPHGIDMISVGKVDEGMAIWNECWDENLISRLNFVTASIVCPGVTCTFLSPEQTEFTGPAMRAALAGNGFQMLKFKSTHHQLDTLKVKFDGPKNATVAGMITATHFSDHQGPETHYIHWTGTLVDTAKGWRITEEDLSTVGHSVLPKAAE